MLQLNKQDAHTSARQICRLLGQAVTDGRWPPVLTNGERLPQPRTCCARLPHVVDKLIVETAGCSHCAAAPVRRQRLAAGVVLLLKLVGM
jgi:hypothetical protein